MRSFFFLYPHAGGHAEGGGDGGQYGDDHMQDFLPEFFVVHDVFGFMSYDFTLNHDFVIQTTEGRKTGC